MDFSGMDEYKYFYILVLELRRHRLWRRGTYLIRADEGWMQKEMEIWTNHIKIQTSTSTKIG